MKKTGKSIFKVCICLLLAMTMLAATTQSVCATTVSSQAKKAIKAYQKYLSGSKVKWDGGYSTEDVPAERVSFSVVDINKDGIPELLLSSNYVSHAMGEQSICIFNKGKVEFMGGADYIKSYYPRSGIVEMYHCGMGNSTWYSKIKNGKDKTIASIEHNYGDPRKKKPDYYWENKQVTKAEFNKLLKKNAGTKKVKVTKSFWHKNTSSNRKNMLKMVKW